MKKIVKVSLWIVGVIAVLESLVLGHHFYAGYKDAESIAYIIKMGDAEDYMEYDQVVEYGDALADLGFDFTSDNHLFGGDVLSVTVMYANAMNHCGRATEARELLMKYLEKSPTQDTAMYHLGKLYQGVDDREALRWFIRAANTDPLNKFPYIRAAGYFEEAGDYDMASQLYANAIVGAGHAEEFYDVVRYCEKVLGFPAKRPYLCTKFCKIMQAYGNKQTGNEAEYKKLRRKLTNDQRAGLDSLIQMGFVPYTDDWKVRHSPKK